MKKSLLSILILLLLFGVESKAQNRSVSGTVISAEDDLPLPGVNVMIKGSTRGTITDLDGKYSIQVSDQDILAFSFVGFVTQEIQAGNQTNINVTLSTDAKVLGEVIVVGYGSVTKGDLTGNIASVKGDELLNVPVPNFTEALQGRMAGVFVESSSGKVGEGVKVRVRGTTSISGGNDPLYVVDGVPVNTSGTLGFSNPLSDLNFNDIESFEVLKDASAAAIYGARGANGVVLITTKSGKAGKTQFNVGIQRGVSTPTRKREMMNASDYVELMLEASENGGYGSEYMEGFLDRFSGHTDWRTLENNTDWQEQAFNPDAGVTKVNFSANGGDEKTRFYFSGNYDKQEGILIRNDFERISGRVNLDHKVSDQFSLGANFGLTRTKTNRLSDDNQFNNPMQLIAIPAISPLRDENGQLSDRPVTPYYNNLIDSENAEWQQIGYRNLTNVFGEYRFTDKLKFRSEFGVDITNQNEERFFGSITNTGESTNGFGTSQWVRVTNYNTNNYFTYTDKFDDRHDLEVVAGMSFQKSDRNYTLVEGQEFPLDALKTLASAAEITGGESTYTVFSFLSYFARANYKLDGKYLFTASGRFDGSSRFGRENQYGFFPAASAGWMISEEDFLQNNSTLSLLKLRASYGLTGNAEIGNFDHLGLFQPAAYGLQPGLTPSQIPNPLLSWEKTAQLDIGIEFGLLNDRITGELDYYHKNTSDLLLNVPVPSTSGFNTQTQNIGDMENRGIELVINSVNVVGPDFSWNTSFNFARNINEVTKLPGGNPITPSSAYLNRIMEGEPIGVFYGPKYAGVNPDNGDALWYNNEELTETTNDFNEAERMVLGSPIPKFIGGISNTFKFKNFDANILFQGVYGNEIFEAGGQYHSANGDFFDNGTKDQMNRWQEPGDITDIPQARLFGSNGTQVSSRYLSDGSYLRLKTVNIGYALPSAFLERYKLSSMRIYFVGQNLLTFTNYKGWDPEVSADHLGTTTSNANLYQGNDFYSAPQAKTFTLGINVGF